MLFLTDKACSKNKINLLKGLVLSAIVLFSGSSHAIEADLTIHTKNAEQVTLNSISPETLKTFVSVIDLVRKEYYEQVDDEELFKDAIAGMLKRLDSHAEFLDARSYDNLRAFTEGELAQVGLDVEYQLQHNRWVVVDVEDNSSADKADINIGDYLQQIDDIELSNAFTKHQVQQLLKGIAGSQIDVIVSKQGRQKRRVTLQRNEVEQASVKVSYVDNMALINIPAFESTTRQEILDGLMVLNEPVYGIVLDVRDNPGGLLDSAVEVASLFQDSGTIVQVEDRYGIQQVITSLSDEANPSILKGIPVVVLQNRFSASASEVLVSSLKNQNIAFVVGERSYGKGSIQSVIQLDESNAVKLTVAHYLQANGKEIDGVGVVPDIEFGTKGVNDNSQDWEKMALSVLKSRISTGVYFNPNLTP